MHDKKDIIMTADDWRDFKTSKNSTYAVRNTKRETNGLETTATSRDNTGEAHTTIAT